MRFTVKSSFISHLMSLLWYLTSIKRYFKVEELAAVSLKNPVKLFITGNTETAMNLRQEFLRIRENHETDRECIVAGST